MVGQSLQANDLALHAVSVVTESPLRHAMANDNLQLRPFEVTEIPSAITRDFVWTLYAMESGRTLAL